MYTHASQRVAGTWSRRILSRSVRGLRAHQDSSQQVGGDRGVPCGVGRNRGWHTRGPRHLQHASGKRDKPGDIFDTMKDRGLQRVGLIVADSQRSGFRNRGKIPRHNVTTLCHKSMISTTNWIGRLNRDFRWVTRMRTSLPNEESVLTLMGSVAMEHKAFNRHLPDITADRILFPD